MLENGQAIYVCVDYLNRFLEEAGIPFLGDTFFLFGVSVIGVLSDVEPVLSCVSGLMTLRFALGGGCVSSGLFGEVTGVLLEFGEVLTDVGEDLFESVSECV